MASRLKPTDAQRIQRALEVWHVAGEPLSALQGRRQASDALEPTLAIALLPDRIRLHEAIARRFDAMLAAGLVDELRALRRRYGLSPQLPAMRCIGYRQAWSYLEGDIDAATLRVRGIAATRQLAKRQFTWLRTMTARPFDPFAAATTDAVTALVGATLKEATPIAHSPVCG
jgi:tRNA dimethylallyltransferase